jgi:acyl carrier protein
MELRDRVFDVFLGVLDDPSLKLTETTSAKDVVGWDSLTHINIIVALERHFKVSFATAEVADLTNEGRNIGSVIEMLKRKLEPQT